MAGRRTDTRDRIQRVALELFAERGYAKTGLREVADRLGITRPALYYHFGSKEEILTGVVEDLLASIDELVAWARSRPRDAAARREILERIAGLLADQWRPLVRFSQVNQAVLDDLPVGERMHASMLTLVSVLRSPEDDPVRGFEAQLAVIALILGNAPQLFGLDLPEHERAGTAMTVALRLLADGS